MKDIDMIKIWNILYGWSQVSFFNHATLVLGNCMKTHISNSTTLTLSKIINYTQKPR